MQQNGVFEDCAVFNADDCVTTIPWGLSQRLHRPSIHMPREWSRLTLLVTGTKIERLHDISEQDCEREGCVWHPSLGVWRIGTPDGFYERADARACFGALWSGINGDAAWDANPEVVCLSFRVVNENIDAIKEAA